MLLIAACTSGDDASADEPTTTMAPATTVAPPATVAAPATSITTEATATTVAAPDPSFAAYCEKNVELIEVRGQVYGPPFDEIPEEIEALLNEAALLSEEFSAWMPEEIRDRAEFLNVAFDGAIDAMTEELGWNPYTAMNSEAASPRSSAILRSGLRSRGSWRSTSSTAGHCRLPDVNPDAHRGPWRSSGSITDPSGIRPWGRYRRWCRNAWATPWGRDRGGRRALLRRMRPG